MAFDPYERRILPQGQVPQVRNVGGEVIGESLQRLGQSGIQFAGQMVRAEEYQKQRDWQAEQPKIAQAIAETDAASTQALADLKANAPEDLSGYSDAVGKYWDDQKAALAQKFGGERAQQYIDLQITNRKGGDLARASADTATAKINARGTGIQKTLDLGVNTVLTNPGQYDATLANINATLDAQAGAVPAAKIAEWRDQAAKSLTGAFIGGQISADPYAAKKRLEAGEWDSQITPQQKAALQNNADAGIRDREIQAAKAQAAAEKAQREQAAVQLSDLTIKLGRGEAGYQDIEKAYAGGKGWLDPNDRSRLTLALDADAAKQAEQAAKAQAGFNFVAGAKLGAYQVDPKNPDQMKAVNTDYLNQAKLWATPTYDPVSGQSSQRTPEQVQDLTLDYVTTLGVVPEALQGQIRGEIRSGSNEEMAAAANTLEQFRQVNPALLDDFDQRDIDRADLINTQVRNGISPEQAFVNTMEMQKVDKGTTEARKQSYQDLTKPPANTTRLQAAQSEVQGVANTWAQRYSPFTSNVPVPVDMAGAYDSLKQDAYIRTGSMDVAKKSASDAIKRVWGQTSINGPTAWMKTPPENFYSAPVEYGLTPEQNTEWMKDQLVTEFTGGSALFDEKAGPVKDRLTLAPTTQVGPDGRPLYSVMFRDSLGNLGPAVDAQGRAMLWAPDWQGSARKQEMDAAAAKKLSDARTTRENKLMAEKEGLPLSILGQMSESQIKDYQAHLAKTQPTDPMVTPDYRAQGSPHPEYRGGTGRPGDIAPELQTAMPAPAEAKSAPKAELQTAMPEPKKAEDLPSWKPMQALNLTPQEKFLYRWHTNNVTGANGGKAIYNADSTSTVLQMEEPAEVFGLKDGKWRNIPSVWDGKAHTEDEAIAHAKKIGVEKWPAYNSQEEAVARYQKMHDIMELDVPRNDQPDQLRGDEMSVGPQSNASDLLPSPEGYTFKKPKKADGSDDQYGDGGSGLSARAVISAVRAASDKELATLKKQARSKTIRDAVEAELTRRGRA
jgi:hypothetical protein